MYFTSKNQFMLLSFDANNVLAVIFLVGIPITLFVLYYRKKKKEVENEEAQRNAKKSEENGKDKVDE